MIDVPVNILWEKQYFRVSSSYFTEISLIINHVYWLEPNHSSNLCDLINDSNVKEQMLRLNHWITDGVKKTENQYIEDYCVNETIHELEHYDNAFLQGASHFGNALSVRCQYLVSALQHMNWFFEAF